MDVQLLGISGSPVPHSNTDWAIKKILKHSGLDWKFIKLSDYDVQPCHACQGCAGGGACVVHDDGSELARLFARARAFVIGGYTPLGSLDARTKAFMERLYCLRHAEGGLRGKVGASVITTACPPDMVELPLSAEIAVRQLDGWMAEEGMQNLGAMVILGNVPCIRCGHGDDCSMNGIKMLYGPPALGTPIRVHQAGDEVKCDQAARELGGRIRQMVEDLGALGRREAV